MKIKATGLALALLFSAGAFADVKERDAASGETTTVCVINGTNAPAELNEILADDVEVELKKVKVSFSPFSAVQIFEATRAARLCALIKQQ